VGNEEVWSFLPVKLAVNSFLDDSKEQNYVLSTISSTYAPKKGLTVYEFIDLKKGKYKG